MSASTDRPVPATGDRRARRAWYTYDWANSVFTNSVTSLFFGPLLTDTVREAAGPDGTVDMLGLPIRVESYYPFLTGFSVVLLLVALPLAGAAARHVPRHLLLGAFSTVGALATVGLFSLQPGTYVVGSALYLLAQVGLACSIVVYGTYLPEISTPGTRGRISANGAAAGYAGGAVVLGISLAVVGLQDPLGIDEDTARRLCIAFAGVWWFVFGALAVRGLPRTTLGHDAGGQDGDAGAALPGLSGLRAALGDLRHNRVLALFLLGFLFFNGAYMTVSTQSSTFASEELKIPESGLVIGVLLVNAVAVGGAILAGRLSSRFGTVPVLLGMLVVWVVNALFAFVVPTGSTAAFLLLATLIGSVHGGTYALARAVFADLVPRRLSGEYFGLFELVNRSLGATGSLAFGLVLQVSGDYRAAMASLAFWFALGGVLLWVSGAGRAISRASAPSDDRASEEVPGAGR